MGDRKSVMRDTNPPNIVVLLNNIEELLNIFQILYIPAADPAMYWPI